MSESIKGYKNLTSEQITLINHIKDAGDGMGKLIDIMLEKPEHYDSRWVHIAKTDLQKGVMALVRAVAQPEGF